MTHQTVDPTLIKLRRVLRLNAVICLMFSSAFMLWPQEVSHGIGNEYPQVLFFVGLGLLFNGLHLLWASRRRMMRCYEVSYFALGDIAWVLATAVLLVLGYGVTKPLGVASAVLVASMVGTFGYLQASYGRSACDAGLLSRAI